MSEKSTAVRRAFSQNLIIVLVAGLFLLLAITKPHFLKFPNLYSLLYGISIEYYALIGLTLLMIMSEMDLSVGSVFALTGAFSGFLCISGLPVVPAILLALLAATGVGLLNGYLVYKLRVNSIILTLGTMILVRGLVTLFVQINGGADYPKLYKEISRVKIFGDLNITIIIMLAVIIVLELLLRRHILFRKMTFIGENIAASRIYGINADKIKLIAFTISGFGAGVAGVLTASRSGQTVFNTGLGLEFKMVTAALLAGSSLYGGKGSIAKSVVALLFLALVLNAMIMYGIDPEFQAVIVGVILIIAIYVDSRLNVAPK
jgi:ribose/xylose/arabinose/galactoside ABC-type transport system permease subunit